MAETRNAHHDTSHDIFRRACAQFATGVTAATAIAPDGELAALTVNSFTSVSLDPPQVLICIGKRTSSYPVMSSAHRLAVHILTEDQEEVARRLSTAGLSGAERLSEIGWSPGAGGEPHLAGVAARLAGRVAQRFPSGDHVIIVIDVDHIDVGDDVNPALLFHRGRFATVGGRPLSEATSSEVAVKEVVP